MLRSGSNNSKFCSKSGYSIKLVTCEERLNLKNLRIFQSLHHFRTHLELAEMELGSIRL